MRIEGTFKSQGKHAAGVVISSSNLNKVCPMVRDKSSSEKIAGMEMNDLAAMGHVKFDILGISFLDKIMGVSNKLSTDLFSSLRVSEKLSCTLYDIDEVKTSFKIRMLVK